MVSRIGRCVVAAGEITRSDVRVVECGNSILFTTRRSSESAVVRRRANAEPSRAGPFVDRQRRSYGTAGRGFAWLTTAVAMSSQS